MASKPIPALCVGRSEKVGKIVVETMMPEYEIIHFTLTEAVNDEIPLLLKGELPQPPSSTIGSGNWSEPPAVLLLGGAVTDDLIQKLQEAVDKDAAAKTIPWLRIDSNKPSPAPPPSPEYAHDIVSRMKIVLAGLKEEGKLGQGRGGVYFA